MLHLFKKMIPARGPQTKLKEIHGLSHHGDERTCPQVLRAKHLLTTGVLQPAELLSRNAPARRLGLSDLISSYWQLGLGTLRYPRYPDDDGKS